MIDNKVTSTDAFISVIDIVRRHRHRHRHRHRPLPPPSLSASETNIAGGCIVYLNIYNNFSRAWILVFQKFAFGVVPFLKC
jgi:hypothetical protein